jgi:hypothetical protein
MPCATAQKSGRTKWYACSRGALTAAHSDSISKGCAAVYTDPDCCCRAAVLQSLMLNSVRAAVQPPPAAFPAAYASSSSRGATPSRSSGPAGGAGGATAAAAAAAAAGSTDEPLQAIDVILYLLQTTGILAHVALLHGCPAIFEAASLNILTGRLLCCAARVLRSACVAQCCSCVAWFRGVLGCAGVSVGLCL